MENNFKFPAITVMKEKRPAYPGNLRHPATVKGQIRGEGLCIG